MSDPSPAELDPRAWLRRAQSNLTFARGGRAIAGVLFEDLCFNLQQSVEKALKGLLVARTGRYPRTHAIAQLMALLHDAGSPVPDRLDAAMELTAYAVRTRYPGPTVVTEVEYVAALQISEAVVLWVAGELGAADLTGGG